MNTNVRLSVLLYVRPSVCLPVCQIYGETWFSRPLIKREVWFLWASLLVYYWIFIERTTLVATSSTSNITYYSKQNDSDVRYFGTNSRHRVASLQKKSDVLVTYPIYTYCYHVWKGLDLSFSNRNIHLLLPNCNS